MNTRWLPRSFLFIAFLGGGWIDAHAVTVEPSQCQNFGPLAAGDYGVDVVLTSFSLGAVYGYPKSIAGNMPLPVLPAPVVEGKLPPRAIEYYNKALDHYFVTPLAIETDALDSGKLKGWPRTGYSFKVNDPGDRSPVCPFYTPPGYGDSHFYSAAPEECMQVAAQYPSLMLETSALFTLELPNPASGSCTLNHVPIYRVWNKRSDSNHRYVSDSVLRDQMIKIGYASEGYGTPAVALCAPK